MTIKQGAIYAAVFACVLSLWRCSRRHTASVNEQVSRETLPQADNQKFIIDEKRHTVTILAREPNRPGRNGNNESGVSKRRLYLPPHASIEVGKDGKVRVTGATWGGEISPFVGGSLASDFRFRLVFGANLVYFRRWEIGPGLALNLSEVRDLRLLAHLSYNVYGNLFVSAGLDHKQAIHLMAGLKF